MAGLHFFGFEDMQNGVAGVSRLGCGDGEKETLRKSALF
jgi:hypothetical protein